MYYENTSPPNGRNPIVYIVIALIALFVSFFNEVFACLFFVFACYMAWVTS